MSRRTLYREKVPIPDSETIATYLSVMPGKDLYAHPERFPRITSSALFDNRHSLELEIGCGSGEFLCSLARHNSGTNYVGVELRRKSVHAAINLASAMSLDNILFLNADARLLYPLLFADSIQAVYLHFPDPVTRPRFDNRRVFTKRFLNAMHEALTIRGRLSVITDHREYFEEMLNLVEGDDRWCKTHRTRFLTGFDVETKSRFQRIWESHGKTTLRFEVRKRGSHRS